ncbi:AI-2E family transporter [Paroceanicella profunda]|uniref:AI-2E family transporter n=1 Tax=Paroceanicella profunda TaxID=2579971 RepID=A0A5B8FTH2_9RHOB|nr:AI-2E family transporter [Paroceanicella profunda]QDL91655.1 AI-2E family transporter [Paroceanicella profunda]
MQDDWRYTRGVVAVLATIALLVIARPVLIPLVLALFVWLILNVTVRGSRRLLLWVGLESHAAARLLSVLVVGATLVLLGAMVGQNAYDIAQGLPQYEQRLDTILSSVLRLFRVSGSVAISDLLDRLELTPILLSLAGSMASVLSSLVIVVVYVLFIHQEAGAAEAKLTALISDPAERERVRRIVQRIIAEIDAFMAVNMLCGLFQAIPTWIVLKVMGVDAPVFWAVLIFVTSFIPTIGTLIGIVFPALMALVQFDTFTPFLVVLAVMLPVQLFASNYLEPRMMSTSLNLSGLVVLVGIFAGGALWGVVGALIVVPVLSVVMLIFAQIPSMRPVALLMSSDGRLED